MCIRDRCTLSRLLYGARYSIGISLPVLLILSVIGLIVGTFSACAGEKADHFITILCEMCIRDRFINTLFSLYICFALYS